MPSGIKIWNVRKELVVLYFAFLDPRTPLYVKLPAIIGMFYLISPIDVIPDFIPFIGYIDDLVIVPLLLNLSIRLLPGTVLEASLLRAAHSRRKLKTLTFLFIVFVIAVLVGIYFLIKSLYK
jgi:uncharacterized membrane protein YkvA (DUF1232 family)